MSARSGKGPEDRTRRSVSPRQPARRGSKARLRSRVARILSVLEQRYPDVRVPLRHGTPLQLLVATILSAQCTDATVNRITPQLFDRYRSALDFAQADPAELEALIHPAGFYRQKARMIRQACRLLVERHGGEVPRTMAELLTLPGVGRKTANVLLSAAQLQGWPGWEPARDGLGIVVDTHVGRLARRLGLTAQRDPNRVEQDLKRLIPPDQWAALPLRLIYFGREVCTARRPRCSSCPLLELCPAGPLGGALPGDWSRRSVKLRGQAGGESSPGARPSADGV